MELSVDGKYQGSIEALSRFGDVITCLSDASNLTHRLLEIINDWENFSQIRALHDGFFLGTLRTCLPVSVLFASTLLQTTPLVNMENQRL
jgi:hypothetical protein